MKSLDVYRVFFVFILTALFCFSVTNCEAQKLPTKKTTSETRDSEEFLKAGFKRYKIESGIVEYNLSGSQTGTETIYFDRWGLREAKYTMSETNMMGMTQRRKTLTLFDGAWVYSIDFDNRTGTKTENPLFKSLSDTSASKDLSKLGEKMLKGMGGRRIGSEKILDKTCDVWEVEEMPFISWVWNGIALRTEVSMMGMDSNIIATKIEEGVKISEDKFEIPQDVVISEDTDPFKELGPTKKSTEEK